MGSGTYFRVCVCGGLRCAGRNFALKCHCQPPPFPLSVTESHILIATRVFTDRESDSACLIYGTS